MFRILDIHPALGFETLDRWYVASHQRDEQIRASGRNPEQAYHRQFGLPRMVVNNISKVIAYHPRLSTIIGIVRIIFILQDPTNNPQKKRMISWHIYRGLGEICLGPWMIVIDVIATIVDKRVVKSYLEYHRGLL
ncbi:MAG: hypothetical protein H0V82_04215 [Candidatus Protochlamydia sp.]|nr:hypothetical protein [Candidatus Protochlamydia sp.]